jgi:hypothetical protein
VGKTNLAISNGCSDELSAGTKVQSRLLEKRTSPIVVRYGVVLVLSNCIAVACNRSIQVALLFEGGTKVAIGGAVIRGDSDLRHRDEGVALPEPSFTVIGRPCSHPITSAPRNILACV